MPPDPIKGVEEGLARSLQVLPGAHVLCYIIAYCTLAYHGSVCYSMLYCSILEKTGCEFLSRVSFGPLNKIHEP